MFRIKFGKYAIIFYIGWNNWSFGVKSGFSGQSFGPIIFIRPRSIDDRGMLEHELVHSRQFWNPRKWFWSKLDKELEAYREQLKWHPDRLEIFATILATRYRLNITKEEATALLKAGSGI